MPNPPVFDEDRQFVNFTLGGPLVVGRQYRLSLGYKGPIENDMAGLYYSTYSATNEVTGETETRYALSRSTTCTCDIALVIVSMWDATRNLILI